MLKTVGILEIYIESGVLINEQFPDQLRLTCMALMLII